MILITPTIRHECSSLLLPLSSLQTVLTFAFDFPNIIQQRPIPWTTAAPLGNQCSLVWFVIHAIGPCFGRSRRSRPTGTRVGL